MKTAAVPTRAAGKPKADGGSSSKPFFKPTGPEERIQARLRLGRPGDRFEAEADRVADRVVDDKPATRVASGITPLIQRQANDAGDGEAETDLEVPESLAAPEVQAKAAVSEPPEDTVQRRAKATGGLTASAEISRQIDASRGRGNPLPGPVRQKMEAQFDADFSGVRIHTDAPAVLLAQHLDAQAFTRGNDIFFNEDKFSPESRDGEHLLAHELTHTVQQGASGPQQEPAEADVVRLAPAPDPTTYEVRPEIVEAIRLARGEIGKVNAKLKDAEGKRVGWERLREYFNTAFGGPVVSQQVLDRVVMVEREVDGKRERRDALPSWCGIFTWWAMKKAGIPIPDWKLGAPGIEALALRPKGQLPRKGDIAIEVKPYNHFAMITGVESAPATPYAVRRVATVNGNTAGDDNLGGQVQERWDPITRWDHFLDPVGKLNLPDVPLVTVSSVPTPIDAVEQNVPVADAKQNIEDNAAHSDEVAALDTDGAPPPTDVFGEAAPEADLTLPPALDVGPAEQVATIEQLDLSGSSDEATTRFIDASPSVMAATQPALAPALDSSLQTEQRALAESPPVLVAKTSGVVDVPVGTAQDLPLPADVSLDSATGPSGGGDLAAVASDTPEPYRGNADRETEMEQETSGSIFDLFKRWMRRFTSDIRTKDDGIDTAAGSRPVVALDKDADTSRMEEQRQKGLTAVRTQRDVHVKAFREHPGQAQIQPRKIDEERPATVSQEPGTPVEALSDTGVADYAAAPLPQDVRDAADAKLAERLTPNLAEARAQALKAASTRDGDKAREIDTAKLAASTLNQETDAAQRRLVIENRGKVATLQGEGIGGAYEQVNTFSAEAAKEQGEKKKAIGKTVRAEEEAARQALVKGENDAKTSKAEGEVEAAKKKLELEKAQKNQGWWQRAKNRIKSAVKAITSAIDKVFTRVRNAVKSIINKAKNFAIGLINKARKWVVERLEEFRTWANSKVDKYLKDAFPALAKRIKGAINSATDFAITGVNKVADAAIERVTALADGLTKALDKILATFQTALKTAVRVVGAVMQGDFAEALRAAIEGACEIAGIDPKPVFEFLDRAGKAIARILRDPVAFVKNLFGAVGDGIGSFFKNIKTHLIGGVIGWLTGALSDVNLTGPFEFSPRGILSIVLQVLGVSYAKIKAKVIKKLPAAAAVFDKVEEGYALLQRVLAEGPAALWEEIKAQVGSLKETVMGAIRSWLITTIIKEGIVWLLALTNPASALVKAVKLVFDLVTFLVERYKQIKDFVLSVYEAVAEMASGNFAKVTGAVENALVRVLPVLISLLASLAGLGGIAKQVKSVIAKVAKPIHRAIDWVVDKIVAFARKLVSVVKTGAKKAKDKGKAVVARILSWWKAKVGFRDATGESHSMYYKGERGQAKLMVASGDPTLLPVFLDGRRQKAATTKTPYSEPEVKAAQQYHRAQVVPTESQLLSADVGGSTAKKAKAEDANQALVAKLKQHLDHLAKKWVRRFFDASDPGDFPPPRLPVMADNAKATSFDADYIVDGSPANGYKYKVKRGTESGDHVGNLGGWSELQGAKLTSGGAKYVRMHCLPHKLGGDAVDSNLTPARGDLFNTPFSHSVEQPAIQASTEGTDPAKRQPIWYRFRITYHSATTTPPAVWPKGQPYPAGAFPKSIEAAWGYYKPPRKGASGIERAAASGTRTDTPPLPDMAVTPPAINKDGPTALFNALSGTGKPISAYFVTDILIRNRPYKSKTEMKDVTWLASDGVREVKRQAHVQTTYDAIGKQVTLN